MQPLDSTFNTTLTEEDEEEVMNVPFEVSICCFNRDKARKVIGKEARVDIFLRSKMWIKDGARVCVDQRRSNSFNWCSWPRNQFGTIGIPHIHTQYRG